MIFVRNILVIFSLIALRKLVLGYRKYDAILDTNFQSLPTSYYYNKILNPENKTTRKNFHLFLEKSIEKRSFDILNKLKSIFNLKKTMAKQNENVAEKCIKNLKFEDQLKNQERNWTCNVIQDKVTNIALLCSCSYEYGCQETKEFHFSFKYNKEIQAKNRLMNVHRGADFQCERILKKTTSNDWSCNIEKNENPSTQDDQYYCKCFYQKKCRHDRYVELY